MKPFRTLIAPVVMAAVATAGLTAVPAKAGNDDLARFLLGVGAVAITLNVLDKKNNRASAARMDRHERVVTLPERGRDQRHQRLSFALPQECLQTYSSNRGNRELYSARCLSRAPYKMAKLPDACAYSVMARNKVRDTAYGPRCLARQGFYPANRDQHESRDRKGGRHIVYQ